MKDKLPNYPEIVTIRLEQSVSVIDSDSFDERELRYVILESGEYRLELICNPFEEKYKSKPWWVVMGTGYGMAVTGWITLESEGVVLIIPDEE